MLDRGAPMVAASAALDRGRRSFESASNSWKVRTTERAWSVMLHEIRICDREMDVRRIH
jgi:hypothetical protein